MSVTSQERPNGRGRFRRPHSLTSELFPLFSQGLARREIASRLQIPYSTVRDYHHKYCKMYGDAKSLKARVGELLSQGVTNRAEIARRLDANQRTINVYCAELAPKKKKISVQTALKLEAEDRGMTKKELIRQLLTTIVERELFADILEPASCATSQSS